MWNQYSRFSTCDTFRVEHNLSEVEIEQDLRMEQNSKMLAVPLAGLIVQRNGSCESTPRLSVLERIGCSSFVQAGSGLRWHRTINIEWHHPLVNNSVVLLFFLFDIS